MAPDRFGSILAFVRVADHGSFAKAGKVLGLSPSAVSKSVARLEGRLGLRLFQRTTRAISLTEEGRAFFLRCAAILQELDEAERDMRERASMPTGVLKVELPTALGRMVIAPQLGTLTGRYPDLRVDASFDDELTDLVEAGLDAVVRIGEPRDSRLMVKRVGTVHYIVCASPAYIKAHGVPEDPSDLTRFNCIRRLPHGSGTYAPWRFVPAGGGATLTVEVAGTLSFDSNDVILDAGLAGTGLVQLHTYMAEPYLRSGRLVEVLQPYAAPGPPISVLFPSNRHLAPKVRVFIDFVTELLGRSDSIA
ncbi:LysR family transcriptional regulator [Aureimonas jatrophae]|uniref:DNA-binding transcriptional regulator, LysR family n=1 Tax=Aureimonas jatrophae TaxID=1166073 RepID=A0A1H0DQU0_9HYPH|nr:LysR family transcriptional regulator [Aureimonas jatrophae]MBB3952024.1 DNA-binding transcriptional LysR family regulator [Aureimonas jatrophae]SDN72403.1 DNA-binding transcriptional regulator, LysR family [Aureimonas jatrophae]